MAHNKLQKAIAVSSMAAATLGAGAIVNADNVNSSSVTPASSSSISATVSSSSQKAKSSSEVTLKSSSKASSKASSSSVEASSSKSSTSKSSTSKASSQKSETKSSAKASSKQAKAADSSKVTPNVSQADLDQMQSYIDKLSDDIQKHQNDSTPAVQTELVGAEMTSSLVTSYINNYLSGLTTQEEVQKDLANIDEQMATLEKLISQTDNETVRSIMQDELNAYKQARAILSQGISSSTSSSSSQTSATSSSKEDLQVSSTVSSSAVTSNTESKSSATSTNNKPNVTPEKSHEVVDKLQPYIDKIADDAEKYGDTDNEDVYNALVDAVNTADKIADVVNDYMQGKATKADTQKVLTEFQNRIKELEKAIADEKDPTVRAIMQDELNALKAAYNELINLMNEQTTTVISSTKSNSTSTQTAAKQSVKSSTSKTTSQKPAKVSTKQLTKEAKSMPQTGEQSSKVGVIAGIGALAMAAAGAFLLRKRG